MAKSEKPIRRAIAVGATAIGSFKTIEEVPLGEGFAATVNGLVVNGTPAFERWAPIHKPLTVIERGSPFAVGDWIRYGEAHYGELASQMIDPSLGWSEKTIKNYVWISERISFERRRMDRLGIAHHQAVAALTAAQQTKWLAKAAADDEEEPWTVARLKKAIAQGGDAPATDWYVLVGPLKSGHAQEELMARLEGQKLAVKAITRRRVKKKEAAA